MLQKWLAYCQYIWCSTNHHGVHSPFVYSFLTASVYSQPKRGFNKKQRVANGICHHFSIESYSRIGVPSIQIQPKQKKDDYSKINLIHVENPSLSLTMDFKINQVVLIEKIHDNNLFKNAWKSLINRHSNIVSIDFFDVGIVFVKDSQAKEHFILRA